MLPKAIREKRRWKAGTLLTVEDRPEGLLLKPVEKKKKFTVDDWAGIVKYKGPPLTVEDMDARDRKGIQATACARSILTFSCGFSFGMMQDS